MVFKHGLLERSTFLFQYDFITHKKLESSRLGELKYALLAGYDIRLKNESLQKGKKRHFTTGVHGHCIAHWLRKVRTSLAKSEHVKRYFSSTVGRTLSKFGPSPQPACSFLTVRLWPNMLVFLAHYALSTDKKVWNCAENPAF